MENTTRNIPNNLPDVEFVDTNTQHLVNKLITQYEKMIGRPLYPADPVRAFILWVASVIIQERILINESAKQNLPRYATGKNLDSLSEIFHNTYRLEPTAASTTLQFLITNTLQQDYIITDTLEVTVDGFINFVTTDYLIFKAGENHAEVNAICTTLGKAGNDFVPGQVDKLVSSEFLYFKEVSNITITAGGSEKESDTALYNRMRESEEAYTTAGSRNSYIYHAKCVSAEICDVSAESPEPGIVDVRIMLSDGKLPTQEIIQKVQQYIGADDVRPLTDKVTVSAPTIVPFDIEVVYYISSDCKNKITDIEKAVKMGVDNYIMWQTGKMGRDINPSYFNATLMQSNIKRLDIVSPAFTTVQKGSIAVLRNCNVTFGGVEDE